MSRWPSWAPRPNEQDSMIEFRSCVNVQVAVLGSPP